MSSAVPAKVSGRILRGSAVGSLDQYSLFDRIINIKFVRKSGRSFAIRSDYEVVLDQAKKPHFIRVRQKPEIKVSYKQVSNDTSIKVDVEITNFFMWMTKAGDSLFAADGDPVDTMVIQMGYINQFPNWTLEPRATGKGYLARFYDMDNFAINSRDAMLDSGLQIQVKVLDAYPKGNPPDQVTYFHGIIGTMEYGARWTQLTESVDSNYGGMTFPDGYTEIEKVLFLFVTRRFISSQFIHTVYDSRTDPANKGKDLDPNDIKQTFRIYDYDLYKGNTTREDQEALPEADRWKTLELDAGCFSTAGGDKSDAMIFGVRCVVSEYLRKNGTNTRARYAPDGGAGMGDGSMIPVLEQQNRIGGQLLAIKDAYPAIRWDVLNDGSYYIYHEAEKDSDLLNDPFVRETRAKRATALPAVYDITVSGMRVIRCPFISFLSPMQMVSFMARYSIGSQVGFYYHPKAKDAWYLIITASIEFSTHGEDNTMELVCTDVPEEPEEA